MPRGISRRGVLGTAAGVAVGGAALLGTTSGAELSGGDAAVGPAQDAPYTVVTAEKSVFAPEVLTIPAGATVTFRGNRYPHTVTSTASLVDVADGCGDGGEPYTGEDVDSYHGERLSALEWAHTVESPTEPYNVRLESGGTTYVTYEAAGQYPYYCVPHCGSFMVGRIDVVEVPE